MPVKTTLKKLNRPVAKEDKKASQTPVQSVPPQSRSGVQAVAMPTKKSCPFCENGKSPTFTDVAFLRKFMSDRAKILNKQRSGVCSKHQRRVAKQIKYARHLSLLPFTNQL